MTAKNDWLPVPDPNTCIYCGEIEKEYEMKVTTVVFKSEEDRQKYVKMQAEYLNLPSAVVQYTFGTYTADPKRGDPANNGKPTIEVTDCADELSYEELIQIMSFEAYSNARHHFDYLGRRLVDFIRTERQAV